MINSQRYICGLLSAPVFLEGLKIVCCVNFKVKYFNRVVYAIKHVYILIAIFRKLCEMFYNLFNE